jgi:hypothetical protein
MPRKLPLSGDAKLVRCGPPPFLLQLDELDRKAYRRSIERWEAEGGATVDCVDGAPPFASDYDFELTGRSGTT